MLRYQIRVIPDPPHRRFPLGPVDFASFLLVEFEHVRRRDDSDIRLVRSGIGIDLRQLAFLKPTIKPVSKR